MTVPQRSRRERFKITVFSVLAAHVLFLLVLLIQGLRAESPVVTIPPADSAVSSPDHGLAPATSQNPALNRAVPPASAPRLAPSNPGAAPTLVRPAARQYAGSAGAFYTVKSGDTLNGIARAHATTVSALKAANGLTSDCLAIGTRLKLPEAKMLTASAIRADQP